jgi:dimethylamine/trimethylamine dehydrogenase
VGGHLRDVIKIPGLTEWSRVVTYREGQLKRLGNVHVVRGTGKVTAEQCLEFGAAKIVLATGAEWVGDGLGATGPEGIPGADASSSECVTPDQFFAGKRVGKRVVVLDSDGYFMAISLALMLADQGKRVTIVTQLDRVAPMTYLTLEGYNLARMLRERKIEERVSHWAQEIEISGGAARVTVYDLYRDGSARTTEPTKGRLPRREGTEAETLICDTVLLCTARRPRNELYQLLSARRAEWREHGIRGIYRAGDCLAPRYLADAIFDGHRLAQEFESPDPQRPKAIIRERQIWGHTVYPKLGDSVI